MKPEVLTDPDLVVFTTRELAMRAGVSVASASRQLARAADTGVLTKVTRGVWANTRNPAFHPHLCVAAILGSEDGYVSFLTALHLHGLISQIPTRVHVATTGHSRRVVTPVGTFELFQLAPKLMREGVEWADTHVPYRIATAEKALFDTLYISTRKGRRFQSLPELELSPRVFSRRRFRELLRGVDDPRIVTAIDRRFDALTGASAAARR